MRLRYLFPTVLTEIGSNTAKDIYSLDSQLQTLWRTTNVKMLRLLSVAVVLLSAVLFERVQGECSTSINNGCTDCMKGCATTDFKQFYYTNGAAILEQHNNLRRRYGRQDLKWSNRLEYEAWMTLEKESECSHDATNRHKDQIIREAGQHLQCDQWMCGHSENIHFPNPSYTNCYDDKSCVQDWINEGWGGGHHDNMASDNNAWVGCWGREGCLKCLYWTK